MRIYVKHILHSIRRSFLQPCLILLTLVVATSALLVAVKTSENMHHSYESGRGADNYVSDITVKRGWPAVSEGDSVVKGQLLISSEKEGIEHE